MIQYNIMNCINEFQKRTDKIIKDKKGFFLIRFLSFYVMLRFVSCYARRSRYISKLHSLHWSACLEWHKPVISKVNLM